MRFAILFSTAIFLLLAQPHAQAQAQTPAHRPAPVQVIELTSPAWADGARIPGKFAQPGHDVSPPLSWTDAPEGTESFVLIAHDLDAMTTDGGEGFIHWLLWDIPKSAHALLEGIPAESQLADGTRQISSSGPWYRGPAAPASGPVHHYVFELYALNAAVDVPAVGQSPAATEAAVRAAMAGKIIGKGVLIGLFKRD
jgi:Raf kinase inhibitor-like YbhB/YbcL family protein